MSDPRVYLVTGGPDLIWREYLLIKSGINPVHETKLVVEKGSDYTFQDVVDALSECAFDDGARLVTLFGVPNRKEFRAGLEAVMHQVTPPHYLVILDLNGIVNGATWNKVVELIRGHGKCRVLESSLESMQKSSQIDAVIEMGRSSHVEVSEETAELLLELLGPDRQGIQSTIDGLVEMELTNPSLEDLRQVVVAGAVDYPVWLFYAAFNSGSFKRILPAARLLQANRYPFDIIIGFAAKQCRWQLLAAEMAMRGKNVPNALRNLGGAKDEEAVKKRIFSYRPDKRYFKPVDNDKPPKRDLLTSEPMIRDIANFVTAALPQACPAGIDRNTWVNQRCLERYLTAHEAAVSLREQPTDSGFVIALRELSPLP